MDVDLDTELPPAGRDSRLRLARLRKDVAAALVDQDAGRDGIEAAVVRFLGAHPARVVEARGAPGWYLAE